jgi:hypothetical protein
MISFEHGGSGLRWVEVTFTADSRSAGHRPTLAWRSFLPGGASLVMMAWAENFCPRRKSSTLTTTCDDVRLGQGLRAPETSCRTSSPEQ